MASLRACLMVAGVLALSAPLRADEAQARAIELFNAGQAAYAEGRFKDAIDSFLLADRTKRSASFAYNIALAYEQMGDDAKSLQWAREYIRRKPAAADRATMDKIVDKMQAALAAKGVQQVTVLSTPPGATLHVDGAPLGVTPWTGTLTPGEHTLYLRAPDHEPLPHTLSVPADRAIDVSVTLQPAAADATSPAPVAAPAPPASMDPGDRPGEGGGVSWWTWTALGVGVAGVGTAVAFEVLRASAEDDARNAADQVEAGERADAMEDHQLAARISLGIGLGFVAAGGVLLILDLVDDGETSVACPSGICSVLRF